MKPRYLLLVLAFLVPASLALADAAPQPAKRILFFSKSTGYEHSVIKEPGRPFKPGGGSMVAGLAFQVLKELGDKNNIEFVFSKDGSLFTPAYLAQFDAIYFHTTGDLTEVGTDGNPAMTPAGKQALLDAVAGGKPFIGTHCASDTFHSPGGKADHAPARYINDGDNADPYIKMIGGEFIIHGQQQPSHLIVADPKFPGMSAVPSDNDMTEEWYSLKDFAPNLHVLLVNQTAGMIGAPYARPNYPSTWARMYGKGRVFYSSLGHRDDMWQSAMFQSVLMGGINWALGRVEADVTPNLDQAAPQANVLPADPGPVK
ncbi:MAG TPA: ThuA domain-containing protein [Opitutaceae bacterium]